MFIRYPAHHHDPRVCQTENKDRREELSSVEEQVKLARDSLPQLKLRRDAVRMSNTNLKDNYGLMGQKALLRDFENRKVTWCVTL